MTLKEAYLYGTECLKAAGIADAALDAWYLLEFVSGRRKSDYYAHGEECLPQNQVERYRELLCKRGNRIPLQHLTGLQDFMGLTFQVGPEVLIPRQDTETLVEEALKVLRPGMRVLDVCTGSGCILLSLLFYCRGLAGVGVDISEDALAVAGKNARSLQLCPDENHPAGAVFYKSDMLDQVDPAELFDCIVSNPPYIASEEIETLMPEVREHEPRVALDGGKDGLYFYRILARDAGRYLKTGGYLFAEIGWDQGIFVSQLFEQAGYRELRVLRDLCGKDRVVCARK